MSKANKLTPEELVKNFKDMFKTKIKSARIKKKAFASKKKEAINIWMKVDKDSFKDVVKHLVKIQYPHLAVVSGTDLGKVIELIYHFTIYYDDALGEITLNISVDLPKSNPTIESLCDIIPGAQVTEREKQEMLGVKIKAIPDDRRLFVPEDFPKEVFPWRRDETGPEKYYKNLHEVKK
jgi:membrane-bound hydrogenase subunit beta